MATSLTAPTDLKNKRAFVESSLIGLLPYLERFAGKLIQNSELWTVMDPRDLVQMTCLRAVRFASRYGPEGSFQAWVTTILKRLFINAVCNLRWESRIITGAKSDKHERFILNQSSGEEASAFAESNEFREAITAAVSDLPPIFREVFVDRELRQMTYEEISQLTGVPDGTVKSRLSRARAQLAADPRVQELCG